MSERSPDRLLTLDTSQGPARAQVFDPGPDSPPQGTLVLSHGAGGGVGAADLQAMTTLQVLGWTVVLVEQPWKVAGGRVATAPPRLDLAWRDLLPALAESLPGGLPRPLVTGGRSAGARVACRTSPGDPQTGLPMADGVLCLAFPLHPPGRPDKSRAAELQVPLDLGIPTLVVQGAADPFGSPAEVAAAVSGPALTLVTVPGSHSPTRSLRALADHVLGWLGGLGERLP